MQISHIDTAPRAGESAHRPGGIGFINLLAGREHTRDNFLFALVDVTDDFHAPRHRHNFEQLRIMLEGTMGFGPGQIQEAGSIGYFCEGTYYTQKGRGRSRTLMLQVGGPSGVGYMSRAQMDAGVKALQQTGHFEAGVYTWTDAAGQKHNKDGYEAIWEHVFQRAVAYEKPRFDQPVIFWPDNFRWLAAGDGVAVRHFARLHERGLEVSQLRLEAGASWDLHATERPLLLFAIEGDGQAGTEAWRASSAIKLERHERATLDARSATVFHVIGLPVFD